MIMGSGSVTATITSIISGGIVIALIVIVGLVVRSLWKKFKDKK